MPDTCKGRGPQDWIQTFSGGVYYPAAPRARDVRLVDIAHHLSLLCRYTGACKRFYSVAEHSVLVSRVVPYHLAFVGLMHDAPEAYLADISTPLKRNLPDYQRIEALNWAAVAEKFHLPIELPHEVHSADVSVFFAEQAALMPPLLQSQGVGGIPADVEIECWSPEVAEVQFIKRFNEITPGWIA